MSPLYVCVVHVQLDSLIGKTVEMVLDGVADAAGNVVPWPITWSFSVADYGASSTFVHVSGLLLETPYATFQAKIDELLNVRQDIATFLSIPVERITKIKSASGLGGNITALSFVIAAPAASDSKTSAAAAQELAVECIKADPGFSGSLAVVITSKVCIQSKDKVTTNVMIGAQL